MILGSQVESREAATIDVVAIVASTTTSRAATFATRTTHERPSSELLLFIPTCTEAAQAAELHQRLRLHVFHD